MDVTELIESLRPVLPGSVIATDFDGTLAPLVRDPQDSRPVAGAIEALTALSAAGAQVAVVTGRDAETVVRLGGLEAVPGLIVEGLYGLETWTDGELRSPEQPGEMHVLRDRLPGLLRAANTDPEVWIEDKRLSLVVHARKADNPDESLAGLEAPVTVLARELGFEVHPGAQVLELRLPGYDKAGAMARLLDGRDTPAVLYCGDDLGDLPAFALLRRLRGAGTPAWSVGVLSSGVSALADAADVRVDDPAAVVGLLAALTG